MVGATGFEPAPPSPPDFCFINTFNVSLQDFRHLRETNGNQEQRMAATKGNISAPITLAAHQTDLASESE
jgi:hypothetical protein